MTTVKGNPWNELSLQRYAACSLNEKEDDQQETWDSMSMIGKPVDPVVGDPVRQDKDKIRILGSFVPSLCVF